MIDEFWDSDRSPLPLDFFRRMRSLVGVESGGAVLGVGVLFGRPQRPMILANVRLSPFAESLRAAAHEGVFRGPPTYTAADLEPGVRERFFLYDAPEEAVAIFVEPPEPAGRFGKVITREGVAIFSGTRGTLGPTVVTSGGPTCLTAGHVAGPVGSSVDLLRVRRLRRTRRTPFGTVAFRSVPVPGGPPAYDVAGVKASEGRTRRSCAIAHLAQFQEAPLNATLTGGVSGRQFGFVQGALDSYSDESGTQKWTNSWLVHPGEIGAEGDSGAAVTTDQGEVIGIFVGGSRVTGSRSFGVLYVQDLESLDRELLSQLNDRN